MGFVINLVVSATAISTASWLSARFPGIAGFIVALPLATMLVLPLSQLEHGSQADPTALAKSIFLAIPMVMLFLLPFLFSERVGLGFWSAYALACAWLAPAFFLHRLLLRLL